MKNSKLVNTALFLASVIILSGCRINRAPSVGNISPSSGASSPGQEVTFTATYSDGNGWQDLKDCRLLVNASANIRNSLCVRYDQNAGKLYLIKDNATNEATCWQGGFSPGSANVIENSYCRLDCSKVTISGSGNNLTISWVVVFKEAFLGSKNTYLYAKDDSNAVKNWTRKGTWKIQVPPDAVAPTGSIKVNNDNQYTNARSVTLNLEAQDNTGGSGLDKMQFSNDNSSWLAAEPFASTKTWDLTAGDGEKTVYARFSDKAGNWSIVYSDTIILDATAPSPPQSVSIAVAANSAVELTWLPNTESDISGYNIYRADVSGGPYTKINSAAVTSANYYDSGLTNGNTYYYVVTALDRAGNESGYSQEVSAEVWLAVTFSTDTLIDTGNLYYENYIVTVDNCTLTLGGEHTFRKLILVNRARVTHLPWSPDPVPGVYLTVQTLSIDPVSIIDVIAAGNPRGPGLSYNGAGSSYGGIGGYNWDPGEVGSVYGDLANPNDMGSGTGGGVVNIHADNIILNGSINADGGVPTPTSGMGSGGSIKITTRSLTGSGTITAGGGPGVIDPGGGRNGGGGGGRIAIFYEDISGFNKSNIHAYGASGRHDGYIFNRGVNGGAGTVYLKSPSQEYGDLIVDNAGLDTDIYSTPLRSVGKGTIMAISTNTLTDDNANFPVPDPQAGSPGLKGLKIKPNLNRPDLFTIVDNTATTITVDGDLTQVAGVGDTYIGVYVFDNLFIKGKARVSSQDDITVLGAIEIDGHLKANNLNYQNASCFHFIDAYIELNEPLFKGDDVTLANAKLTLRDTSLYAHDLILSQGSILRHFSPTSAASGLRLTVHTLNIDAASIIDVITRGDPGGLGISYNGAGSSYGGVGGYNWDPGEVGRIYGDVINPDNMGSGTGGGLVNIHADSIVLNGSINADGGTPDGGIGSGGSINITTRVLSGSGSISAGGGPGIIDPGGGRNGGGGGGRIAIFYEDISEFNKNNIHAYGGSGRHEGYIFNRGANGGAGTVYLKSSSQEYGDLIVDNAGLDTYGYSTPLRSVGKGTITAISDNTLTNSNASFPLPDPQTGALGLKGLKINPNLKQSKLFAIINNTATTITVDGDLGQVANVGDTYAGVYVFDNVTVTNAAKVLCDDYINIKENLVKQNGGELVIDLQMPTAIINFPAPDNTVSGSVAVSGTATDEHFRSFTLEYGEGASPASWIQINVGLSPVNSGVLGTWDTTILQNGLYTLRLRTKDAIDNSAVMTLQVTVYNAGPDITDLSARPNPFSPDESGTWIDLTTGEVFNEPGPNRILDDIAAVSFTASGASFFNIRIFDAGDQLVRQLAAKPLYPDSQSGKVTVEWDGRDNSGSFVRNGQYKLVVNAGAAEKEKFIMIGVDKKPFITVVQANPNPFWPDGDGIDDSAAISYNISDNAYVTAEVYQDNTLVRRLADNQMETAGNHSYSWDGKDTQGTLLPKGKYTVKISATAETGNIADPAYLDVFMLFIANIHISRDEFNPNTSEAADIAYKLADERQLSIKIYNNAGSLVRNLILNQARTTGEHLENWDGKDDAGNIVPDDAYYFIIEDNQDGLIYDPRGTGGKDISKSLSLSATGFNPLKNEFCVLTYTLPQPAKINLKVRYNRYSGPAVRVIKYQEPTASGQHRALWDGRDESGNFVNYADFTFGLWGYTLEENSILVTGSRPQIKSAGISLIRFNPNLDPYRPQLAHETILVFELSRQARASVHIYNSSGNLVRTLLDDAPCEAGSHSLAWDGKDNQGRFLAADYYRVVIQAHNGESYSEPLTLHSEIYY